MIVLREEEPGPWGKRPEERPGEELVRKGLLVVDKPRGPTSHQVSAWMRDLFGVKAGHSGTLDPGVSGVLPIGLGKGTALLHYLIPLPKEYVGVMELHRDAPEEEVLRVFREFTGPIYQRPPVKSAVKRRLRIRHVYELELLEKDGRLVLFRARVERGTYIRKLCHDMGLVLGTGAHMAELRRTAVGFMDESWAHDLLYIRDAYELWRETGNDCYIKKVVRPIEEGIRHMKKIVVSDGAVDSLAHGASLKIPGILRLDEGIRRGEKVAVLTQKGELVMIGEALMGSEEMIKRERGEAVRPERVFMERGVYPRGWRRKDIK